MRCLSVIFISLLFVIKLIAGNTFADFELLRKDRIGEGSIQHISVARDREYYAVTVSGDVYLRSLNESLSLYPGALTNTYAYSAFPVGNGGNVLLEGCRCADLVSALSGQLLASFVNGADATDDQQSIIVQPLGHERRVFLDFSRASVTTQALEALPDHFSYLSHRLPGDGICFVRESGSGELVIWNELRAEEVARKVFRNAVDIISGVGALSAATRTAVISTSSNDVKITYTYPIYIWQWETDSVKVLQSERTTGLEINKISLATDAFTLATSTVDHGSGEQRHHTTDVLVWDFGNVSALHVLEHDSRVTCVAMERFGQMVLVGTTDGLVYVWRRKNSAAVRGKKQNGAEGSGEIGGSP